MTEHYNPGTGEKVSQRKTKSEPEKIRTVGNAATAVQLRDAKVSKDMKRLIMACVPDVGITRSSSLSHSPLAGLLQSLAPKEMRFEGLSQPLRLGRPEAIRQSLFAMAEDDRIIDYDVMTKAEGIEPYRIIFRKALLQHEEVIPQQCLCEVLFMVLIQHCKMRLVRAVAPLSHEWTLEYKEPEIVTELPQEYSQKSEEKAAKTARRLKVEPTEVDTLMGQLAKGREEGAADKRIREILLG